MNNNNAIKDEIDIIENDQLKNLNVFDTKFRNQKGKRAKRQHSQSLSLSSVPNLEFEDTKVLSKDDSHKTTIPDRLPFGKNSKKSRCGNKESRRGMGGKGKWNYQDDMDELEMDRKDPCYESENESINLESLEPLSDEKFDEKVTEYVQEYFENSDSDEFMQNIEDMKLSSKLRSKITYLCVLQALQRKPAQCELTSRLLSEMIESVMTESEVTEGFELIISELKELTIDCPEAPIIVGKFIARAVADHLLPEKFVQNYKLMQHKMQQTNRNNNNELALSEEQLQTLAKAENLLSLQQAYARLDAVWGVRGGERPTKMLTHKIKMLLSEYVDSGDEIEAQRCVSELEAPHFHHEIVFQAILMVIERSTEFVCTRMVKLLDSLCEYVTITVDQLELGITRVYDQMSDIVLDVPAAYMILERFIKYARKDASFFPENLMHKMPKNTRSRFVSEGHGFIR